MGRTIHVIVGLVCAGMVLASFCLVDALDTYGIEQPMRGFALAAAGVLGILLNAFVANYRFPDDIESVG